MASKFLAVGSVVPWAEAKVGVIATQSYANTSYGPRGLALMKEGFSATEVVDRLIKEDEERELRQVGAIDANGNASSYTGSKCLDWAGHRIGKDYACQGNILVGPETLKAMAAKFEESPGELPDRLVAALLAGDRAGGDRRGKESAAILVLRKGGGYGGLNDVYVDLRVDDHSEPVIELSRLLRLHHLFLGSSQPNEKLSIDDTLVRELQSLMKRLGYYRGEINNRWDNPTQQALREFIGTENLEERVDLTNRTIDPPALEYLRDKFSE